MRLFYYFLRLFLIVCVFVCVLFQMLSQSVSSLSVISPSSDSVPEEINPLDILTRMNESHSSLHSVTSNRLVDSLVNIGSGLRQLMFMQRLMLIYVAMWQFEKGLLEESKKTHEKIKRNGVKYTQARRIVFWLFTKFETRVCHNTYTPTLFPPSFLFLLFHFFPFFYLFHLLFSCSFLLLLQCHPIILHHLFFVIGKNCSNLSHHLEHISRTEHYPVIPSTRTFITAIDANEPTLTPIFRLQAAIQQEKEKTALPFPSSPPSLSQTQTAFPCPSDCLYACLSFSPFLYLFVCSDSP